MSSTLIDGDNKRNNFATKDLELSCFKLLNQYQARLFISCKKPLEHVTFTQKNPKGEISWVEFKAPFHSHMVKVALVLFDKPPLLMAKRALLFLF